MAKMDRFVTVTAGYFTTRTWAERIDRPSGDTQRDDTPMGSIMWYRSFRIRHLPELAGIPAQRIKVTDDNGQSWTVDSVQETADRNRYMMLECFRGV